MYLTYPLMECVSSLENEFDDTVPKKQWSICFSKKSVENTVQFFDIVLRSDGKKQGTQYNKSRCILD